MSGGGFGVAGIEGAAPQCVVAGGSGLVPHFARGACGAVVVHLNLVTMGPAVVPFVPCGFDVIPVDGAWAVVGGCDYGCDYGRAMGTVVVIRAVRLLYVLYCF